MVGRPIDPSTAVEPGSARRRRSLLAVCKEDPKTVLAVLAGGTTTCGLASQVIFYGVFGIPYLAYVGENDLLSLAQALPLTLAIVMLIAFVAAAALLTAIIGREIVKKTYWQLQIGWAATVRALLSGLRSAARRTADHLMRIDNERASTWSARRLERLKAASEAITSLEVFCEVNAWTYRLATRPKVRRRIRTTHQRRRSLDWWWLFTNRRYFEMFVAITMVTALLGVGASYATAARMKAKIHPQTEAPGWMWQKVDAVFNFVSPRFMQAAAVSLDSLPALQDVNFLGTTSEYAFFLRGDGTPLVVPAAEIDLVTLGRGSIPEELRKPDQNGEQMIAGFLEHLGSPARLSPDCRDNMIPGVDFRFAYNDANPLALVTLTGPITAVSGEKYPEVSVKEYNAVQRARLVDYVTTTRFDYLPGDYLLVEGHASTEGGVAYNQDLAEERAKQIVAYLGAPAIWHHVEPVGRGEDAWQNDPLDPRNRQVLVYHCRPQPRPLGGQMAEATNS